jgi:8-oxo-dGTP pyrophosphatase MutT (NUDIX family)
VLIDDDALAARLLPIPDAFASDEGLRAAAVVAPLFRRDGVDRLLFTLRPETLVRHAGQVSFPGGMREGDESPVECALRELFEEIGVTSLRVNVLGSLPPRRSIGGLHVTPLVARVTDVDELVLDPREVSRVLDAPLHALADPSLWESRRPITDPQRSESPHFTLDDVPLWGLTARFVLDLVARLPSVS